MQIEQSPFHSFSWLSSGPKRNRAAQCLFLIARVHQHRGVFISARD
jgi:hypothetical protein